MLLLMIIIAAVAVLSAAAYFYRKYTASMYEYSRVQLYENADKPFRFSPETPTRKSGSSEMRTPPTNQSSMSSASGLFTGKKSSTPDRRWGKEELSTDVFATQRLIAEELDDVDVEDPRPPPRSRN